MITGVLVASAVGTTAVADEYASMHKQLNIMSKIIKSSMNEDQSRRSSRINGVDSVYLKGQGVVFTISSNAHHSNWGNYNFNFVMPDVPVPPVAPMADIHIDIDDDEMEEEITRSMAESMEKAAESYERAVDSLYEEREEYRDIRNTQRDLAYEMREIERELKDLEYRVRRGDKEAKAEIIQKQKELAQERKKIEQAQIELKKKAEVVAKKQKAKRQNQEKERKEYYGKLSNALAETFCLYGNGLKAVPRTENVSLIIKSGGEKKGNRYMDKIYVFSKKDISDCAVDKISVAKLLEKGKGYQF